MKKSVQHRRTLIGAGDAGMYMDSELMFEMECSRRVARLSVTPVNSWNTVKYHEVLSCQWIVNKLKCMQARQTKLNVERMRENNCYNLLHCLLFWMERWNVRNVTLDWSWDVWFDESLLMISVDRVSIGTLQKLDCARLSVIIFTQIDMIAI